MENKNLTRYFRAASVVPTKMPKGFLFALQVSMTCRTTCWTSGWAGSPGCPRDWLISIGPMNSTSISSRRHSSSVWAAAQLFLQLPGNHLTYSSRLGVKISKFTRTSSPTTSA